MVMKKIIAFAAVAALCAPVYAAPNIPGLKAGVGGAIQSFGTPSNSGGGPSPTPAPLVPGSTPVGSWSATSAPPTQGSGSSFITIAQWDMVPRQALTAVDNQICVVAYSAPKDGTRYAAKPNDMAKVRFIANNGSPVDVSSSTTSGRAAPLEEFCTNVDLSGVSAGDAVEVRAIAYPTNGVPVVLQGGDANQYGNYYSQDGFYSFFFQAKPSITRYYVATTGNNSNSCTSSGAACQTVAGALAKVGSSNDHSSVEICLAAGSYSLSSGDSVNRPAATGYLTITPCPTVAKSDVIIDSWGNGTRTARTHVKGLLISNGAQRIFAISSGNSTHSIWLDDVDWVNAVSCRGSGGTNGGCTYAVTAVSAYQGGIYLTDVYLENFHAATYGLTFGRNVDIDHINADSYQQSRTVLNGTVSNVINCCSVHSDINQQSTSEMYNHILAGITATSNIDGAGVFNDGTPNPAGDFHRAAFVDLTINNGVNPGRYNVRLAAGGENIYFKGLTLSGGPIGAGGVTSPWYVIDSNCTGKATSENFGSVPTYFGSTGCGP
jgi:hypothetical protein